MRLKIQKLTKLISQTFLFLNPNVALRTQMLALLESISGMNPMLLSVLIFKLREDAGKAVSFSFTMTNLTLQY